MTLQDVMKLAKQLSTRDKELLIEQLKLDLESNSSNGRKTQKTLEEIKQILISYKSFLVEKFKINEVGVFGSYVRGEQTEDSDVDILIDFLEVPTLFDLVEIKDLLSERIGIPVDLVEKGSLRTGISKNVLSEIIYV